MINLFDESVELINHEGRLENKILQYVYQPRLPIANDSPDEGIRSRGVSIRIRA